LSCCFRHPEEEEEDFSGFDEEEDDASSDDDEDESRLAPYLDHEKADFREGALERAGGIAEIVSQPMEGSRQGHISMISLPTFRVVSGPRLFTEKLAYPCCLRFFATDEAFEA
jgi:hypothetical protein